MYGYVRTCVPELKVREQEYYRAVYCGLCRTMGKCTGQCSRMALSYDMTFFALVRMALCGEKPVMRARRCFVHPMRRRPMAEPNDVLRFTARVSGVLAYHKLRDDRRDERGVKYTAAALALPYVAQVRRRAVRRGEALLREADAAAFHTLSALSRLEASRPASVDEPAECFGTLMATLLAIGLDGERATLARHIGRHIGRFVYILDAADDFEEDVRCGRYNPFACLYGDPCMKALPSAKREEIHTALLAELVGLEAAIDLLDIPNDPDLTALIGNILYLGLPREAERVLGDMGRQDRQES